MMNWKQSLRHHPMIRCPKNTQQIDWRNFHAEAWFQQSCFYASLLKSHLVWVPPLDVDLLDMPQNAPKMEHLQECLLLPMHLQHTYC